MRRRIDVDEALPSVAIPGPVLHELFAHARDVSPEECCGLIVGDDRERYANVVRCRNEMTRRHAEDPQTFPRTNRDGFWMNEGDYVRACEEAQARGARVTAVYHSHVGAGPYLSALDLEYAEHPLFPFPDADQVVVAVLEDHVTGAGLFRRDPATQAFVGVPVEAGRP